MQSISRFSKKQNEDVCECDHCFLFVMFAWIFFRSQSLNEAVFFVGHLFDGVTNLKQYVVDGCHLLEISRIEAARICLCMLLPLGLYDVVSMQNDLLACIAEKRVFIRWGIYFGFALLCLLQVPMGQSEFIYFQF